MMPFNFPILSLRFWQSVISECRIAWGLLHVTDEWKAECLKPYVHGKSRYWVTEECDRRYAK